MTDKAFWALFAMRFAQARRGRTLEALPPWRLAQMFEAVAADIQADDFDPQAKACAEDLWRKAGLAERPAVLNDGEKVLSRREDAPAGDPLDLAVRFRDALQAVGFTAADEHMRALALVFTNVVGRPSTARFWFD